MNSWDDREARFEEKPVRTAISGSVRVGVVVAVIIGIALVLGAGFWVLKVATSDVKGQGDAEIVKNEVGNRIRAQEGFEKRYAAIKTADLNINVTADALKAQPSSTKLQTELNGQRMTCNSLVGEYNAASRSFTTEEFRAADLPYQINSDTVTTETDCKENAK